MSQGQKIGEQGARSLIDPLVLAPIFPFKFFAQFFLLVSLQIGQRLHGGRGWRQPQDSGKPGQRSTPEPERLLVRYCTALQNPPRVRQASPSVQGYAPRRESSVYHSVYHGKRYCDQTRVRRFFGQRKSLLI